MYAHDGKLLVKEKDTVKKGQKIAEMGGTNTESPRLHFEIRRQGKPAESTKFLRPLAGCHPMSGDAFLPERDAAEEIRDLHDSGFVEDIAGLSITRSAPRRCSGDRGNQAGTCRPSSDFHAHQLI